MTVSSKPQIFVNGKKTSQDRLLPASFSEENMFAFESLRSYGGVIFRLEEHVDRLFETAKTVGLELTKTREELMKELRNCLDQTAAGDLFLRLMVNERDSFIFLLERKRPDVFAAMERELSSAYESVFLNQEGYVTEATIWNLFMVKAGVLMTPGTGILHGVTRQFVIECAVAEHLPVQETNLTRHDFWNADEAFLTNTSGEIVPIRSLDGRVIGRQIPGSVTQQLMTRFRKEVERELANAN
jgi:branched-chain amino acid aminotransferase